MTSIRADSHVQRTRRGRSKEPWPDIVSIAMSSGIDSSRAWSGPDDLTSIEGLVSAAWTGPSRPRVNATVGDLEW
jgi:hypothetical protein